MNLSVTRVSHVGAFSGGLPGSSNAATHGVSGKVENVDVTTGGQDDCVTPMRLDITIDHVTAGNTLGNTINHDQVKHLTAFVKFNRAGFYLARECRVSTEQQLLTGLAAGIESTGNLSTAERAVVQVASVVTGKRYALGNTLVDDVVRYLSQTPDVCFTGTEVAALDGIVEETINGVTVVRIVLSSVDAALRCDGVSAAGAVLIAEGFNLVAKLAKRSSCGTTGEAGSDAENFVFTLIRRIDQLRFEAMTIP